MTKKKNELDVKNIDYDKLAIAIITEWDSDREESGRKELVKGMSYILSKYQTEEERGIIDDMLMTFTGWTLRTLLKKAEAVSDDEVSDNEFWRKGENTMTVERLINQLKKFNPKAEVRLNDHCGTIALFALATVDDNDLVWIEGKDDIDLGEEIYARFEKASEMQMDELDFFLDLLDMGITLEDIKECCPDKYEYSKAFMEDHGLI